MDQQTDSNLDRNQEKEFKLLFISIFLERNNIHLVGTENQQLADAAVIRTLSIRDQRDAKRDAAEKHAVRAKRGIIDNKAYMTLKRMLTNLLHEVLWYNGDPKESLQTHHRNNPTITKAFDIFAQMLDGMRPEGSGRGKRTDLSIRDLYYCALDIQSAFKLSAEDSYKLVFFCQDTSGTIRSASSLCRALRDRNQKTQTRLAREAQEASARSPQVDLEQLF
jgi:hypothetical protein